MKATTEPLFPGLNRWLQSLRCTMFHSTWTGSFLHHKSDLKTWTLSPWARDLRSPELQLLAASCSSAAGSSFLRHGPSGSPEHGKDVVRRERRSEWHQNGQKKGWQCTECIAMWGQQMPQIIKPLRISNHVKSVYIPCAQIHHIKPLRLLEIHKFHLLKHYCIR